MPLKEILAKEFVGHSQEVWVRVLPLSILIRVKEKRILDGYVLVNDKRTTPDAFLQHEDMLTHMYHRHEEPVTGD
jgi:hypothetical protein